MDQKMDMMFLAMMSKVTESIGCAPPTAQQPWAQQQPPTAQQAWAQQQPPTAQQAWAQQQPQQRQPTVQQLGQPPQTAPGQPWAQQPRAQAAAAGPVQWQGAPVNVAVAADAATGWAKWAQAQFENPEATQTAITQAIHILDSVSFDQVGPM